MICFVERTIPTITCPGDIPQATDSGSSTASIDVLGVVTVEHPVEDSASLVVTSTGTADGDMYPIGTTVVTVTVTDSSGDSDTCEVTVTVEGWCTLIFMLNR